MSTTDTATTPTTPCGWQFPSRDGDQVVCNREAEHGGAHRYTPAGELRIPQAMTDAIDAAAALAAAAEHEVVGYVGRKITVSEAYDYETQVKRPTARVLFHGTGTSTSQVQRRDVKRYATAAGAERHLPTGYVVVPVLAGEAGHLAMFSDDLAAADEAVEAYVAEQTMAAAAEAQRQFTAAVQYEAENMPAVTSSLRRSCWRALEWGTGGDESARERKYGEAEALYRVATVMDERHVTPEQANRWIADLAIDALRDATRSVGSSNPIGLVREQMRRQGAADAYREALYAITERANAIA